MSLRRSTLATLATVAMTLGTTAPALAVQPRDVAVASTPAPLIVTSAGPSTGGGGMNTLVVILLSTGALVAGAVAGFGGAKAAASRSPLHPH